MGIFCGVAVEKTKFNFDKIFDYEVPIALESKALCGCRVMVPFGKGDKLRQGMIMYLSKGDTSEMKPVNLVLDDARVITEEMVSLASFMKERYFCTYYECIKAMIPSAMHYDTAKLIKKGFGLSLRPEIPEQAPKVQSVAMKKTDTILTQEQQLAYLNLYNKYKSSKPVVSMLYGITGSGKTSVFMKLIEDVYRDNKSVILMVPEIALTPQIINVFQELYGEESVSFHSGLSLKERMKAYRMMLSGRVKIVIGTRSAVLAPLENIGLIIMDESQESAYKSDRSPRYSTLEIAKYRTANHKGLLLLSSATPDMVSYYHAVTGRYDMNVLKERFGFAQLPEVITADMNAELSYGNTSGFSSALLEAIDENLERGYQTILLLNRRGHHTFLTCKGCHEPVQCPNCSISLTFHSVNNKLMCHYCGYTVPYSEKCPVCGHLGLRHQGTGTQKTEKDLAEIFPSARILRLDTDCVSKKNTHEHLLSAFASGDYNILVGTQMVAKGLNFPNVTLVGVVNADQILYGDDYQSFEKAFSLLTQVVGRSGRGNKKGKAIIQTYTPENPVIAMAARQDYESFYKSEILLRKALLYPPFADICVLMFIGLDKLTAQNGALHFSKLLVETVSTYFENMPIRILGPCPVPVLKVEKRYRYQLILKCRNSKNFRQMLSGLLIEFQNNKDFKNLKVNIDINS